MRFFLGVDVGATKTHALVADESGQALGLGEAGPGNWQGVGYAGLGQALRTAVGQALQAAGLKAADIAGAGFGLAGYDWPSQLDAHLEVVASLGLNCPPKLVNDAVIGLVAGAPEGWGVGLIAGTGNNCRGRDRHGREGRITGEGERFGEYGGAGEIVNRAVQMIAYEWTRRGPPTRLTPAFLQRAGARDLDDLIEGMDLNRYEPDPSWAPLVFEVARAGDGVACEVLAWVARELGGSACGVIRQLELEHETFDVVLAGSVFSGGELYIAPLRDTIQRLARGARLVRLEAPPVTGGVLLGMEQVLGRAAYAHRERLLETTRAVVEARQ